MDEFPDVTRTSGEFVPKFWINAELKKCPFLIRLLVELVYQPTLFPKRLNELYELILNNLKESNKTFKYFVNQNLVDFNIEFVGPGKLPTFIKI